MDMKNVFSIAYRNRQIDKYQKSFVYFLEFVVQYLMLPGQIEN